MTMKNQEPEQVRLAKDQINAASSILYLWLEDTIWSKEYVRSMLGNLPNQSIVRDRLIRIPSDYYRVLRIYWGEEFALDFSNYINERIMHQRDLLSAMIAGNQSEADLHTKELYANADKMAAFLSKYPRWDKTEWQKMLYSNIKSYINQISAIQTGDSASEISIYESLIKDAIIMGNYLAYGILTNIIVR